MDPSYGIVFDIVTAGYNGWDHAFRSGLGGLMLLVLAGTMWAKRLRMTTQLGFAIALAIFFTLFNLWTFAFTRSKYLEHVAMVQDMRCSTVEGPVEDFVPMPAHGHGLESFSIRGVHFEYSDFVDRQAFQQVNLPPRTDRSWHGGAHLLRPGRQHHFALGT